MRVEILAPNESIPAEVIFPQQTHSCNIREVITGEEDLSDCDGIWCDRSASFTLGVKTADCAPIALWDGQRYGIVHAGWRGLVGGIIETMLEVFEEPEIVVGPILPQFEIQRDFCYDAIYEKFGDQYFLPLPGGARGGIMKESEGVIFDFQSALQSLIPTAKFDLRITAQEPHLASWRRDQDTRRNVTFITPRYQND